MASENTAPAGGGIFALTGLYERALLVVAALFPSAVTVYLMKFQAPPLRFEHIRFHETAIGVSIIAGGFVAWVTWQCYRSTAEPFLKWLSAGLFGFAVVYAPHGVFTGFFDRNMWFFLLYGPASRLVMSVCLFTGLVVYGRAPRQQPSTGSRAFVLGAAGAFLAVDLGVAALAWSPVAGHPLVRMSMEISALAICLAGVVLIFYRRIQMPLMVLYAVALALFAQSSFTFLFAKVWTHLWWYAHLIFVGGFLLLSFGVVKAFHTTRSFSTVYSIKEMMERLKAQKDRTVSALRQLKKANRELEVRSVEQAETVAELRKALAEVKQLSGLLPICAHCKKVRDDKGYWNQIEAYIEEHSEAAFSHSICSDCAEKHFPDLEQYKD